jgi:type II intron maturase/AI2M/AI1M-like HNH endonuclease
MTDTDFSIIAQYQVEYRGVVDYYQLAHNRHRFSQLKYVMERSLVKTLANKYRITGRRVLTRYRAVLHTENGPRPGMRVVIDRGPDKRPLIAQWGGISLRRKTTVTVLNDQPPKIWSNRRTELVQRLLADTCELCGSQHSVEVHHIRALKDLRSNGRAQPPEWVQRCQRRPNPDPLAASES